MIEIEGFGPLVGTGGMLSYSAMGATIGTIIPGIGTIVGASIGAVVDVAFGFGDKKKAKKKMKKAIQAALIQRYHNTIFMSALERMNEAMLYLIELGLKPGTPDYDIALKKKLSSEIGYEGGCSLRLYGPPPDRPLILHIDKEGKVISSSGYITPELPNQWRQACQELHQSVLRGWLEMQVEEAEFQKALYEEQEDAQRNLITKVMVNAGIIIFLTAFSQRQKRKARKLLEAQ